MCLAQHKHIRDYVSLSNVYTIYFGCCEFTINLDYGIIQQKSAGCWRKYSGDIIKTCLNFPIDSVMLEESRWIIT